MADVKIQLPNGDVVVATNAASEDTLRDILAAMQGDANKKRKEKLDEENVKKVNQGLKDQADSLEDALEAAKKEQIAKGKLNKETLSLTTAIKEGTKEVGAAFGEMLGASMNAFAKYLNSYDEMAAQPVQAGRDMLQFIIDITQKMASVGINVVSAVGQGLVSWIPLVGDGLGRIIEQIEGVAQDVVQFAGDVATFVNDLLSKEFQKRIDTLNMYASNFVSLAGGLSDVATLAGGAGLPIKLFGEAVAKARPFLNQIGLAGGDAAKQLSRAMAGLATTTGRSGRALRDELFAMGISFQEQGSMMAQYMAQLRSFGQDIRNIPAATLAKGTAEYAKHLRVLSDLTGKDAAALMEQARAEAQRGALMDKLTANQARAFQDSFAIFSMLPDQQGAKLQSALAQLLAGGTVTDPIIAGNAIVMDMLKKTAMQVSQGNVNMVTATQANLSQAANQYRQAGESVTDFATLMNPGGTGQVAQGMAQFGNALRQFRYFPDAASVALEQTEAMAQASGDYVAITETMMGFQIQMEQLAGEALPAYTKAMLWATETTMDVVGDGIKYIKAMYEAGGDSMKQLSAAVNFVADLMNAPEGPSGAIAGKLESFIPGLGRLASLGASGSAVAGATHEEEGQPGEFSQPTLFDFFDDGGIASGPQSGHTAMLHGTEAVVPLPDGRTIPVEIRNQSASAEAVAISNLTSAVNQQTAKMDQLVNLMEKNNNLTSGILQASY